MNATYDVVVVGSGPNGLAAAIALSRAGLRTVVLEGRSTPGGGMRTQTSTLPGFVHDVCSSVHPLGLGSPFFQRLELERHGLRWRFSDAPLAHVVDSDQVVTLERSVEATAAQLGTDGPAYVSLFAPLVANCQKLLGDILGPLGIPKHPLPLARFSTLALQSASGLIRRRFRTPAAGGLFAGVAAHSMVPLDDLATASFGLVLGMVGHALGWPLAVGGSGAITEALSRCYAESDGEIRTNHYVTGLGDLPKARAYVFDVTPRQLLRILGEKLPPVYRARLGRYRYGSGVFKMDWALDAPIPWRNPACARAATVHLSGDAEQIARGERLPHTGGRSESPFVLLVQPTLADPSRAPAGKHVGWAYCHVPAGSEDDWSALIEGHIERYAPGFKSCILQRVTRTAQQMEAYNPNYVGGDINGGLASLSQLFFRPVLSLDPYATGISNVFLCSSATPPGGGVHGMCGYHAARSVMKNVFHRPLLDDI